ncbi:MAG: hypothetical protein AAF517_14605 [Planctomycetota bacterium]
MVEPPETCDDGNLADDDTCPADCIIDPCPPTGRHGTRPTFDTRPVDLGVPECKELDTTARGDHALRSR